MGYGCHHGGFAGGFALVLVLFILLVIIGAAWTAW
ncbi:YjcZ family sporulation protein [Evansella sp. AB-rgal1]